MTALAGAAIALAALTLVSRISPISNLFGVLMASASPFAPFVALAGLLLSALSRRTSLTIIAVLVITVTAAVQIPRYSFIRPAATQFADVRVLSSNLRKGQADPNAFAMLAQSSADILTVSELTPEAMEGFSHTVIDEAFPYSVLNPGPGAGGIGLWSRYPLTAVSPGAQRSLNLAAARVHVPGVRLAPLVASIHVYSPLASQQDTVDGWEASIANAKTTLNEFAAVAGSGAVIVAGDFNTTSDMQQFRNLLSNGYRDAADQAGAGFIPTFPADTWLPPALDIDHVVARGATATSMHAATVVGSDHRALLAKVRIPTVAQPVSQISSY
ncbi:endonuclease/exonuclease/phosphatase family protein [Mycobacterium sp. SA01]